MKKIFTLLAFAFTIFSSWAVAQTNTACNADFTFVISGDSVHFTPVANPDSPFIHHTWIFGDGTAAQDVYAPSHTYSDTGTYVVTQYVMKIGTAGEVICSDTVRKKVSITSLPCNIKPGFTWRIDSVNRTVYFTNTTFAPSTLAVPAIWFFGDDSSSTSWSATHTYAKPGKYYVCLRLQPSANCVKYQCDSITIPLPVVCNIQAYFNSTVDSIHSNVIHFNNYTLNLATSDSTIWSFGDGTTSYDVNPTHSFTDTGTYNVCLHIKRILTPGTAPCVSEFCRTVKISPSTVCDFKIGYTWTLDSLNHNEVHFTNTSASSATASVRWSFGDNSPLDSTWNTTHVFAPGKYYVCLRIQLNPNCVKYQCDSITIPTTVCNLKASYTWKIDSLTHNTVLFTNTTALTTTSGVSVKWSFGDGSPLDSTWNTTHTYLQAGKYYVCLRVQTNANCVSYQCDSITVPATECNFQPNYTWQLDSRSQNTVDFTNTTITTIAGASARWFFGDGASDSTWNTIHTFAQPGKYYVCLRVQLNTNCYKYQCDSITIPTPVCNTKASYTWKVDSLKQNTIDFTNTTILPPTLNPIPAGAAIWIFGDGSPLDSSWNATHTFAQTGKYNVCLRIQTSANCRSYQCDSIIVPAGIICNLQAYFNSTVDSVHSNVIHFHNYTLNLATSDSTIWTFGDGTTSYDVSPTHSFTDTGTYNGCLHVKRILTPGTTPCVSEFCRSVKISLSTACDFKIGYTWQLGSVNQNEVHFTNTSSVTSSTVSVRWSFGDGSPLDSSWNPTHVFAQPGKYYVCLRIQTTPNCVKYQCDSIIIPAPICNIKANYTWKLDPVHANTVDFTNTTTTSTTAGITARWYFGDGTYDSTWNVVHTYAQPGKYYVCLRVQTSNTCVSYQCDSITVPAPVAPTCKQLSLFTLVTSTINSQYYTFTPTYPATDVQYTWTFGDNDGSENITTSHYYLNPGIYTACLTAYRDSNCASTTCKEIVVRPQVICDSIHLYYNYYQNGNEPNMVYFYTTLNYPVTQQTWTITSLTNTASPIIINRSNPVYVFTDTGYYNVCLRATTIGGCIKEYCNTIHITTIATPCELYAYPNPAHTQVSLNVQLNSPEMIHAYLYSSQNMLLLQTDQQGNTGNNIVTINTANLAAGFYTIKLIYGSRTCYAKFQKL